MTALTHCTACGCPMSVHDFIWRSGTCDACAPIPRPHPAPYTPTTPSPARLPGDRHGGAV